MTRRIELRRQRVGSHDSSDPDNVRDLQDRVEKHERLTRGKPKQTFKAVLERRRREDGSEEEREEPADREALLGYTPHQAKQLKPGPSVRRSAKVILKP